MKTTMTLSANMNCSVFDIYDQDTDEVIMTINYYILLGEEEENQHTTKTTAHAWTKHADKKTERIRVNDATATGGWF
jgi:hypothetical protein